MAPKPLSLSLPSFSALSPFRHINPNPTLLRFYSAKPSSYIVICKSTDSETRHNEKSPAYLTHNYSESDTEPDGSGAASPTRGEIFLERQKSVAASAMVLAAVKKRKKKKDKVLKVSSMLPSCYGCGAPLQTLEMDAPGYVDPETYELVWLISMLAFTM